MIIANQHLHLFGFNIQQSRTLNCVPLSLSSNPPFLFLGCVFHPPRETATFQCPPTVHVFAAGGPFGNVIFICPWQLRRIKALHT